MDLEDYHFTRYAQEAENDNSWASDHVFSLHLDRESNRLWLGTGSGLEVFDLAAEKFITQLFTEEFGEAPSRFRNG